MTFKNYLIDLWLTCRHGKWKVHRVEATLTRLFDDFTVQVKFEGGEVSYDPSYRLDYYAVCARTGDAILCDSKREAEDQVSIRNDMRGW